MWSVIRPQGPGGPARAYRYRLALRRPYRYRYRPQGPGEPARASATVWRYRTATGLWVRVDGGRGVPWVGLARVRARKGPYSL